MLPPRKLNPFETHSEQEEIRSMNLNDRIVELEARNLHLQTLVVELLDKNEQLRRALAQQKQELPA